MSINYKSSGVDIEAGDELVDWLKGQKATEQVHHENVVSGVGGFAALFRLDLKKYKNPLLVSCTDGVGTKILLASRFDSYESVGQDLVAMCVNDLICTGGDPLFFLDYFSTSRLDVSQAKRFLSGVRRACEESQLYLIGGETAEMPGVYQPGDFDCAGFAVGVVDEAQKIGPHLVKPGDQLVALPSSGFHSNGYSLLRNLFKEDLQDWKELLLTPTALYVQAIEALKARVPIHALCHVTGGGMDNLPRILPHGTKARLQAWTLPEAYNEVLKRSQMSQQELLQTLNCGIGMVAVVSPEDKDSSLDVLNKIGISAFHLGGVEEGAGEAGWVLESSLL